MNRLIQKINSLFEQTLLPLAEHFSNQPILRAIRSALIVTLPLLLVGSLAELLNSFPLPAYKVFMVEQFGPNWHIFGQNIKNSTVAVMSLIMLFSISQHLAEHFNAKHPVIQVSPIISGLVSFVCFLCLVRPDINTNILSNRWLGSAGLFVAIISSLLSTHFFLYFHSLKKMRLHLRGGTPDIAIPQAFNAMLPGIFTVLIFATASTLIEVFAKISIPEAVHILVQKPFGSIGDGLNNSMFYIFSLHILWFFGIHGANVLDPITHGIYAPMALANQVAAAAGEPLPYIMTKTFMEAFVFMGGAGTSICLVFALILFGRTQANRKLGLVSFVPGLFNINEVLMFGLPIVLNPLMLIPFVATPLVLAGLSFAAAATGLLPGASVTVEWTTPMLLNGYLSTQSVMGPIVQLINLIVGTLIYAPFVILSNKINQKRNTTAFSQLLNRACATTDSSKRCIDHQDDAGSLARNLLTDLSDDIKVEQRLFLVFQPQLSAHDERVVGVEALIRWNHEIYGLIPAPITVALAEESLLIHPIGLWVFKKACKTCRRWKDKGINNVTMAVNFSALQLTEDLPEKLMSILQYYQLEPAELEIEVTESRALDSESTESLVLSKLFSLGFLIAIDDFGMGHSSLKYLKQFPVTMIKIDAAISREVVTNPICADIVAAITKLCRARNMISLAEYVDNNAQAELLKALGCDQFQGFKYSKPLRAHDGYEFIRKNHERLELLKKAAPPTFT